MASVVACSFCTHFHSVRKCHIWQGAPRQQCIYDNSASMSAGDFRHGLLVGLALHIAVISQQERNMKEKNCIYFQNSDRFFLRCESRYAVRRTLQKVHVPFFQLIAWWCRLLTLNMQPIQGDGLWTRVRQIRFTFLFFFLQSTARAHFSSAYCC